MFNPGYLKRRLGQYAALWVGGFLLSGAAILAGLMFADLMVAIDRVLPVLLGVLALGLGVGAVLTFLSNETLGTKLTVLLLAALLVLPLLWAPVSAAVAIAFFADRSIEYSESYAAFQIGISRVLSRSARRWATATCSAGSGPRSSGSRPWSASSRRWRRSGRRSGGCWGLSR